MKLLKVKDYEELSRKASEIIVRDIKKKPSSVIGFATGKTPLELYKNLVREYKKGKVNFSKIKSFNLDEYYPVEKKSKKSFYYYMFKNLFSKINIRKENINLLNGKARDFKKECENYELLIKKNPIDIQILGVGENGHIGFNEPGSDFNSRTRLVELTSAKGKALTMGISTIIKSKKILLLASGKKKAKAIKKLVKGRISGKFPVSYLKKHKSLLIIIDEKAGSLL